MDSLHSRAIEIRRLKVLDLLSTPALPGGKREAPIEQRNLDAVHYLALLGALPQDAFADAIITPVEMLAIDHCPIAPGVAIEIHHRAHPRPITRVGVIQDPPTRRQLPGNHRTEILEGSRDWLGGDRARTTPGGCADTLPPS